jgi:disulfide oxidoreductase YuzD
MIDYTSLKQTYNIYIDSLLDIKGFGSNCVLNFSSILSQCPNCIYDANLKKSANKYMIGGPVPFGNGQICPYCSGVGVKKETKNETIPMAVLWEYKSWIIKPINIENPSGFIQTIAKKDYINSILNTESMYVLIEGSIEEPLFQLDAEPTPAGLDNRYIVCQWKKIKK